MKSTQIFCLLGLCSMITFASCKPKNNTPLSEPHTAINTKKADLGDLYQYYHSTPVTLDQKDENTIIEYIADKNIETVRTKSGVYIHTIAEGRGEQIKWGDEITVDYKGYFLDSQKFDSSYDRGEPISFRVGNMNAGWNEALPFLKKGTKATLLIPSHMGYGKRGFPGFVGPDKILLFDIEIFDDLK